jgi:uncharacterized membrane protein YqgA involved in biofilm formation
MLGTLVNVGAIAAGSGLGLLLKKGIPDRLKETIIKGNGVAVIVIGIAGCLKEVFALDNGSLETRNLLLLVFSLFLGSIMGELINIEKALDRFGGFLQRKTKSEKGLFIKGFVTSSLIYCVGAMSIMGALNDGLTGDSTTLMIKSLLDGSTSIVLASTFGIGVLFSVIPVLLYQGSITLLAGTLAPMLSVDLISQISLVGNALIFVIGINLISEKKIRVGNMLPAILIPIVYNLIQNLL